ncbi:MAG: hypothetical protein M2R45_03263 [Verrucomicrobia subdivision 3 bacterium]|nr:hypothetical protein [Limisphaerales bacterium]MCS1416124.1 hypothetical protein [Limisphaerales bacterium]
MTKRKATTMSVTQLFQRFPDEASCLVRLERACWNGTPICPHCGGKVKAVVVDSTDAATLQVFVAEHAVPDATVYTGDATAYAPLHRRYHHESVKHSIGEYVRGDVHTNGVESVWGVLKRSIHDTWHYVSPKHLGHYVDEATFRLNEGNCEIDTLDRMETFAEQIGNKRLRYRDLIKHNGLSSKVVTV